MSRVVLVHGFTQTGGSWAGVAGELRGEHDVVTPEVVIGDDLWDTARRLGTAAGRGTYVGYSMGGRLALHLALAEPAAVAGLVLLSATAGIEDAGQRAARRAEDEARARDIEAHGADEFLERWLSQPMFAGLPASAAKDRCRDAATLVASLRRCGTGTQESLWDRLDSIEVPTLVVAGERDPKFVTLAERLAAHLPHADLAVIPAAGHAAHLEQPDAFVEVLRRWVASH